jgi:hypothetical protein
MLSLADSEGVDQLRLILRGFASTDDENNQKPVLSPHVISRDQGRVYPD